MATILSQAQQGFNYVDVANELYRVISRDRLI